MRVLDPLDVQGFFWLPAKPDEEIPGRLTVSESGDVSLQLLGIFESGLLSINSSELPIILGVTERGKHVTLVDCLYKNRSLHFPGIPITDIYASLLLVGSHFSNKDDLLFSKVLFHVEGLDKWLGITGISANCDLGNQEAEITYKRPKQIDHQLNDDLVLSIRFNWSAPIGGGNIFKATITQTAVLCLEAPNVRKFSELIDSVRQINNLLCLALDKPVALTSAHVSRPDIVEDVGGKKRPIEMDVYYPSLPHPDTPPEIHRPQMLFPYQEVESNFDSILSKWLDGYRQLEPAFNLYFSATTAKHAFLETQFLFLVQGLEALHRRIGGSKNGKLRKRLTELLAPLAKHFGDNKKNEALVSDIVNTRDYLTHYIPELESQAKTGTDLWRLCTKMEVLFELQLLRQIGFSSVQIDRIVNGNYRTKRKLKDET